MDKAIGIVVGGVMLLTLVFGVRHMIRLALGRRGSGRRRTREETIVGLALSSIAEDDGGSLD